MQDALDELMKQIPKEKIKEAKKNISPDYITENLGIKQRTKMQYVSKFKYDDFNKLLKEKNLIKLRLEDILKYIENGIKDEDLIPAKYGVTIPIENSIISISDKNTDGYEAYFYSETACNKSFVYIYFIANNTIMPFVCLTVKLSSGKITYKYHKKMIDAGYVNYKPEDSRVTALFDYFLSANLFIKSSIENRKTIYRKKKTSNTTTKTAKKSSGKSKAKNNIIVLNADKVIYEIETNETVQDFKRTYIRHTEAWTVRSFDRHYKSGKVVHIKEHVRGNKTSNTKKNVYTIKGGIYCKK